MWTKDSTDKVSAWYKSQLSKKKGFTQVNMPNFGGATNGTTMYRFTSGSDTVTVMTRPAQAKGGTNIIVSKGSGQFLGGQRPFQNQGQNPYQNGNPYQNQNGSPNQNQGQSY